MFPAKFQTVLQEGAAIHLRLQIELWEDRPVWDKLAHPAVVSVFRIVLDPATRQVRVADRYGEVSRQAAWQEPLTLRPDLGRADSLADGARYYVRVLATLGTIAEKESAAGEQRRLRRRRQLRQHRGNGEDAVSRRAAGERIPAERVVRDALARGHRPRAEGRREDSVAPGLAAAVADARPDLAPTCCADPIALFFFFKRNWIRKSPAVR